MSDRIVAPCEWKAADAAGSGELVGYMSVFNVRDQGGDVIQRGAFKKSFGDWSRAKSPMPLISDHEISTSGVIGSVVHLAEDDYGAAIRARFSSIAKAQNVRQLMLEGHLSGMSFTYQPVRFHHGTFAGEPARFLDEVKVFEASVVPLPMNTLALASAKRAGPLITDHADADRRLRELEQWARAAEREESTRHQIEHPRGEMYAAGVQLRVRLDQRQRAVEAWALSHPYERDDPTRRPDRTSRAERAYREAEARAMFTPLTRCGVCWRCRTGMACDRYR